MSEREVVILSGVRTAIGDYGGSLKDIAPSELAARVVKEAVARAKVDPKDVGQCVIGSVIHTEPKDMYISRLACVNGGLPQDTGAFTVNRLCGSGMQAIVSASQYILLGETDVAVAGGAESMSRAIYASLTQRWGARMSDSKMMDMMVGALTDPFDTVHMGVTAENVAAKCGLTRADQDAFAVEPQARRGGHRCRPLQEPDPAHRAEEQEGTCRVRHRRACPCRFVAGGDGKLKAVFIKENGTVTAGNASGINDAASAVVLMEKSAAAAKGLKPMARLVAYGHAGIGSAIMGLGPVSAGSARWPKRALKIGDMDVIESNEASRRRR
jgi:acetyl-CoA C-acetyltransferase